MTPNLNEITEHDFDLLSEALDALDHRHCQPITGMLPIGLSPTSPEFIALGEELDRRIAAEEAKRKLTREHIAILRVKMIMLRDACAADIGDELSKGKADQ